jgi:fucose permease
MNGLHLMFGVGAFMAPIVAARALGWTGDIAGAYWFAAAMMVPIAVWFLRLPSPERRKTATTAVGDAPVSKALIALVSLFFFLAVGAEVAMAGWTFNYGEAIGLDSDGAAALAAMFWGAYTFGRLIAIPISTRVPAMRVMVADLAGCVAGAALFMFGPVWPVAAWAGAFLIGLAMASIFPTMLTFIGGRLNVTGKINSVLFAGSNLGAMTFPWLIGQFFEPLGPQALSAAVFAAMAGAAVVFAVINAATRRSERMALQHAIGPHPP